MKKLLSKCAAALLALFIAGCFVSCGSKGGEAVVPDDKPIIAPDDKPVEEPDEKPEEKPDEGDPSVGGGLTYNGRMEKYFGGVEGTGFTRYVTSLYRYENNAELVENAIYASPYGKGDGSFKSPCSLQDAIDEVKAGQTVYLLGGTYDPGDADGFFINCKGSDQAYITIRNYPNESVKIINSRTGKEACALQVEANTCNVILEGLEICNVNARCAYGVVFWGDGQHDIIIRNCNIHDIKTTSANPEKDEDAGANAVLLMGESKSPVKNVALIDNYCHDNLNGWSENISVTANCENIYVVGNRVESCSNIGIDFDGNEGYCSVPALDQPRSCLAAGNRVKDIYCAYAECAGLYVDGARDVLLQYNEVTGCQFGIEVGSEQRRDDYPVKNIAVKENVLKGNTVCGLRIGGYEEVETGVVLDVSVQGNLLVRNGESEIVIAKADGVTFKENSVAAKEGAYIVCTDFSESYCKNLTFTANVFYCENLAADELAFYMFGREYAGINAFNALFSGDNIYREIK